MAQVAIAEKIYDRKGSFPKPDFSKYLGEKISCFGISVSSSLDVFVQLDTQTTNEVLDKIDQLYEKLDHGNYPEVRNLTPGSPLLAYFAQDEGLYRARLIRQLDGDRSRVFFVDYGTMEVIPNKHLMDCPKDLIDFVEGASECALSGFDGEESEEELNFLQEAIAEKDLVARIEELDYEIRSRNRILLTIVTAQGTLKSLMDARFRANRNTGNVNLKSLHSEDVFDGAASSKKKLVENTSYMATDDFKSKLVNYGTNNNNNLATDETIIQLKAEYAKQLMEKDKEIKFCYEQRQEETKRANSEISALKAKLNELSGATNTKQNADNLTNPYSDMKTKLDNIHLRLLDNPSSSSGGGALSKNEILLIERNKEFDQVLKSILQVLSNLLSSFTNEKAEAREKQTATEKELAETKRELAKARQELDILRGAR